MRIFTKQKFTSRVLSATLLLLSTAGAFAQNATVIRNDRDNSPKSITLPSGTNYRPAEAQGIFSQYLDINKATDELVLVSTSNGKMGVSVDRYHQYFKGIKIDRSAYTVFSKDGKVTFLTGNFYKTDPAMPTTPGLTEAQAFDKALEHIGAQKYMWQDAGEEAAYKEMLGNPDTSYLPKGKIVYIERMSYSGGDGTLHLAYSFDIYAKAPLSRDIVYVDAATGEILHRKPLIMHTIATGASLYSATVPMVTGHVGANYFLHDSTRGNGIFTYNANNTTSYTNTNFVSSVLNWLTPDAGIDAHWGAEMVYDYWLNEQGRNSFNDAGAAIRSYVHYDVDYNNAFWDGLRMTYGDGTGTGNGGFDPLTSIDVCAHEIGHAVCTYTADLDYVAESGGMNEGFSDIWGAVIENWANPFEVDAEAKEIWRIGEEISNSALRNMANPPLHGDPDTYQGNFWVSTTGPCTGGSGGNDWCGVHTNSGVLNKWFYLLTVGETGVNDNGDPYNVTGLGFTKSALIAYNTEQALVNNSQFADARVASINVANALYGPCSPEAESVTNAWYAVGVGTPFVVCTPTIGFGSTSLTESEWNSTTVCPSTKVVNIPVTISAAPIGGNPTVTVSVIGGNAVAGVDYVLAGGTLTFNAGSTATQNVSMTIFDDGAVNDDTYLVLQLAMSANGSNALLSTVTDTIHIDIENDDNAPMAGSSNTFTVLTNNTTSNGGSPFQSSNRNVRMQYLMTATELSAAGLVPGNPLSSIAFNVMTKNSSTPYNGFTVSLQNTAATTLPSMVLGGFTDVFTGNVSTVLGWNTLPFSTNYIWTGGSIIVNVCFSNTTNITQNDVCQGYQGGPTLNRYNKNNGNTAGCTLTTTTGNSVARPVVRFGQITPGTEIESANGSSRIWNVRSGTEVYFYSTADSQLIAGLDNITNNLGCVNANLSGAGNGFVPTVYGGTTRSLKEFTITPSMNGSSTSYTAKLYMTTAELNGVSANTLFVVKTNEPTDATINMANSVLATPVVNSAAEYTEFNGNFTGFARYFLTDGPLPPPIPVITPAGPTTFCPGASVMLNGNTQTGVSYSWLRNGTLIAGANGSSYSAMLAGNYQFIMTNSVNVSDTSAVVTVTHHPLPDVTVTPSGTVNICTGGNVTLNAPIVTGYTYQWRVNNGIMSGATSSSFNANGGGLYDVIITSAIGCADTSLQTNVVENPNPVAVAGSNTPVCTGSSLNLTANSVAGATYAWTGPLGFNTGIQNPSIGNVQANNAGDYILTVTNTATGCIGKDTITVTTQNGVLPAQPGSIAGANPVCSGITETYSVQAVPGATSYTWTLPGGWIGTSTTNSINVTTGVLSGGITVTADNSCGSSPMQIQPVNVNVTPNTPGVIGNIVYCLNEPPVPLEATGTNILWYDVSTGGTGSPVAPTPQTNTVGSTAFYASQNNGICESQRSIILVTVNPLPVVNVVQTGNTLTADGAYPFYQWYLNGVMIIGATNQVYVATQNGDYTVMASDINGCSYTTDPIVITDFPVGIASVSGNEPKFYPNPTTGMCWLELPSTSAQTEVLITDIAGKVIQRNLVKDQSKISFDLSKVAKGIYMVKVITAEQTFTSRITLQ